MDYLTTYIKDFFKKYNTIFNQKSFIVKQMLPLFKQSFLDI